jgi:hypothetical protein
MSVTTVLGTEHYTQELAGLSKSKVPWRRSVNQVARTHSQTQRFVPEIAKFPKFIKKIYIYMVLALVFEQLQDFLSYRTAAARP